MKLQDPSVLEIENASTASSPTALDVLLSARTKTVRSERPAVNGLFNSFVGNLVGFTESGTALVDFAANPEPQPIPAKHACPILREDAGREAVLILENGDIRKPIILGLLQPNLASSLQATESQPVNVTVDGESVALAAKNEIVLRCGKASITLTRAGKIIIRGAYLLSRSSGVNRIKGGSVQIN